MHLLSSTLLPLLLLLPASLSLATNPPSVPLSHGLTGFGTVPSNIRDKYDDTLSFGSAIALEPGSWKKHKKRHSKQTYYTGTLWMLPDRGWNTNGTTAYQVRVHKFGIRFSPLDKGEKEVQKENLEFIYKDTVLLRDPKGDPVTGLDPDRSLTFSSKKPGRTSFPPLPAATVQGNGFGGPGNGATNPIRVCLDPEGLALSLDKRGELTGFYISDEYGPYVYRFSATTGIMDVAIRPPSYYIPQRNGADSFASNNPPIFAPDQVPEPEDPSSGRNNNQGFEGMTVVRGEGRGGDERLYVLLQSALMQDGGEEKYTNRYTRLLEYEVSSSSQTKNKSPVLKGEYVVPLPTYYDVRIKKNTYNSLPRFKTQANPQIASLSSPPKNPPPIPVLPPNPPFYPSPTPQAHS